MWTEEVSAQLGKRDGGTGGLAGKGGRLAGGRGRRVQMEWADGWQKRACGEEAVAESLARVADLQRGGSNRGRTRAGSIEYL